MGCGSTKEKLENRMLELKLKKIEIKKERKARIKDLERLTGKRVIRDEIPDYIDSSNDKNEEINSENSSDNNYTESKNNSKKNSSSKNSNNIESLSDVSSEDLVNDNMNKKK